ncbi:hypothetical protein NKH77_41755 [Streptomyces sp. M19]
MRLGGPLAVPVTPDLLAADPRRRTSPRPRRRPRTTWSTCRWTAGSRRRNRPCTPSMSTCV